MDDSKLMYLAWMSAWVLLLACCGFGLWKGRAPERLGAIFILAHWAAGALIEWTVPAGMRAIPQLIDDAALAIAFLVIALRYASFWLGGAMIFSAVQFMLHAYYFVLERPQDTLHFWINNLNAAAILLCLVAGTIGSRWLRARETRLA